VCQACDTDLPRLGSPLCRQCATPIPDGQLCGACLGAPPAFDRLVAAFEYGFPIDALIHALKYGRRLAVARFLAGAMAPLLDEGVDAVVPMPLSDARVRERGFNQAHEIAHYIGHARQLRVATAFCRRVTDTPPQAMLPWKERARNVRGAFVCTANLDGMRIAVVDDVATTGSTLNELSRVLKHAGASRVTGWVSARAVRRAGLPQRPGRRLQAYQPTMDV
jgi:ComF family protein